MPFSKLPTRGLFPRTGSLSSMYAGNQSHKGLVLGLAPRAKARKTGFGSMISEPVRRRNSPDLQPWRQQVRQRQHYNRIIMQLRGARRIMRPVHRHGRNCKVTAGVADAMFHVAAVPAVHACPFRRGNVALIMSRFELEAFLTPIEKHQIDVLGNVPPLVIAIIISPLTTRLVWDRSRKSDQAPRLFTRVLKHGSKPSPDLAVPLPKSWE
jgi:hypothetical protein